MTSCFLYEHSDISKRNFTQYNIVHLMQCKNNLTAFSQNKIRVISNSLALKTYIN